MALLNVDPEKQADAFYRYKMPRVMIKVEGNGNGIKTVICNILEISERLARNVEYPMRFFAHELAATSKLKDDKWILTGSHNQEKVQACIFDFIKRFVLCKACRNPETVIRVDLKKNILLDCKACSRTTDIAPTEKLCNVILKCEKPTKDEKMDKVIAEATAKVKEEKKGKKSKDKEGKKARTKDELEEERLDQLTRQIREEDAVLSDEIARPHPVAVLKELVNATPPPSIDDFVSKVLDLKEDYGLTEDKHVVTLVFEALFDGNIATQLSSRHKMLARFVKVDIEKDVINNLLFLCVQEAPLKPKFHILLKKFYDLDLVSDEAILAWHEKKKGPKSVSKEDYAFFKAKTAPLVEWLQQDDEDDDDDSDASSEEAVKPAAGSKSAAQKAEAEEEEDDIDIDAI